MDNAGTQYKGKKIKVAPGRNSVTLSLTGKDADGNSISFGSFKYNVKGFPKPVVLTPSISKDRGGFLKWVFLHHHHCRGNLTLFLVETLMVLVFQERELQQPILCRLREVRLRVSIYV